MPNTACDGGNTTKLFEMVSRQIASANLVTVQRKYFNETKGNVIIHVPFSVYIFVKLACLTL